METLNIDFGGSEDYLPTHILKLEYKPDTDPHLTQADLNYSNSRRITAGDLLQQYTSRVLDAKSKFLKDVDDCYKKLQNDYPAAVRMDLIIGKEKFTRKSSTTETKSTNSSSICPVNNCNARTARLKRHINAVHPEIKEQAISFAIKMGSILARNGKNLNNEPTNGTKRISNKYKCTNLVNRKSNYKECLMCKKLYKNMCAHVQDKHKVKKTDANYKNLVYHSPVVPSIYVKYTDGVPKKMSQAEMEEIKIEKEKNK